MIAQSRRIRNEIINGVILHDAGLFGRKDNRPVGIHTFRLVHSIWIWLCLCAFSGTSIAQNYQNYQTWDLQTWDLPDGAIARFGKGGISEGDRVIAFSPEGTYLAVATKIGVWLYDVRTTSERALFLTSEHSFVRNAVAFSPDSSKVAVADIGEVKLWEISTQTNVLTLQRNLGLVFAVAFSPDGTKLAVAGSALKLWEVETGRMLRTLAQRKLRINSVAFSPDGEKLATGAEDKTVKMWDVESGKNIDAFMGHTDVVMSVAFSPDGTRLAPGSRDHTIRLWNVKSGEHIDTLGRSASPSIAGQMLWVIFGSITRIGGHTEEISSVAFSPDGTTLASSSSDGTVKLWQVETGRNTTTLAAPGWFSKSVAFSPDGEIIACTSERLGAVSEDIQIRCTMSPSRQTERSSLRVQQIRLLYCGTS